MNPVNTTRGIEVERLDLKPLQGDRTPSLIGSSPDQRLGVKPLHLGAIVYAATLLFSPAALAQYEISGGSFSRLFVPGAPAAQIATQPQFAGEMANSGGSAARAESATLTARFPSSTSGMVLHRSSLGTTLAAGVPRYLLGEVILPPNTDLAGTELAAGSDYWRKEPVRAGELFAHPAGAPASETPIAAGTARSFYYSPHAGRVFASQAGRVAVKWVTRTPVAIAGDTNLRYRYRDEIFAVSSATTRPTRSIYWTERSFNSPVVTIPTGKIETVNPVYSANFPAQVAQEYQPVGYNPPDPTAAPPAEKRTLWFEKTAGIGQLRAYNHEGRIFVEYLGAIKPTAPDTHEFLGADIVEVGRIAPSVNATVNLGEQITPRDDLNRLLPLDASSEWFASPVNAATPDAQSYYGSVTRPDGRTIYHAERENDNPDRVVFYWLEQSDAGIHFLGAGKPNLNLYWPKHRNNYLQQWPAALSAFAHYTVSTAGSTTATGVQFAPSSIPQIVYQDDTSQTQARLDTGTQRLVVTFSSDGLNRTLLKFTSGSEVWYVRLYTQADGRAGFEESDGLTAINAAATVGDRIDAPAGYVAGGYIAEGTNYLPSAYLNPFTQGAVAAEKGAIIPVNAMPGNNQLRVWWFKKITPPSAAFDPFYVPAKVARYTVSYPATPPLIVLASNAGSGDLAPAEIAGQIYLQNDRTLPGFNPNEEHAMMIAGRAYALRDDLNVTAANPATYTSEPFVLLSYTALDQRPAMRAFKVQRELDLAGTVDDKFFNYPVTAGTILQAPMPLPLLPLPLNPNGTVRNLEVPGVADTAHQGPSHYTKFTFEDRKGYHWVYRGPHATGTPTLGMQFYYTMRAGFFVPGATTQPAVGTILPYLRPLDAGAPVGDPVTGTSLTVIYRPVWPENAPELRVAETLTLPKFGLPAVLPQASAHVLYQQSVAVDGVTKPSVVLHDPIREKTMSLGGTGLLQSIPTSALTSTYQGKTYFQRLPPHLQKRFFFDPLRGTKGALVLQGKFVDEIAGEDYLQLNVLSAADVAALQGVVSLTDTNANAWRAAIDSLATAVETFVEDSAKAGSFKPTSSPALVTARQLAEISDSDTAVADYALTATGSGAGWVTMLFGNGRAFTPQGDPVAIQVFKVAPRLYTGDLKVQLSTNPLDEQVALFHSGDFAARPDNYEFEWRYAPPQDGVAPFTYTLALTSRLGTSWQLAAPPAGALPTTTEYTSAQAVSLPRAVQVYPAGFAQAGTRPGSVLRSVGGVDFTTGLPARVIFSADTTDLTGFVLYVNGTAALAHQAPASFTSTPGATGLVAGGLPRQFEVDVNFFQTAVNRVEIALFSSADLGTSAPVDFRLHASTETDLVVAGGSPWQTPTGTLLNHAIVGGSPTAPLGSPLLVMTDNYFTMRYRPKASTNSVAGTAWSRWMPPKLVEGWIKRVLAAINPFNQRMRDLYNNAVNTDVSLLTQAGKRWEGDIALTLENINDFGLIEIYETVLNRGRMMSVDAGYDYAPANDALLLAAGYLADLYTIAGNEAFADAANPTISLDNSDTVTEVNTSRFSFEGQVASVLSEELALLRGRDDSLAPGVAVAPAYNRLYWNYTRGINSGEALYAVNYNIREKSGAPTADGTVDAADAQRMFPQGHGDAYGHYLTALKGYYHLLRSSNFTWTPRSEAVTVLGQAVQVDYFDERKFASAAVGVARTAQQVVTLTHRQAYKDDPAAGWSHFRDGQQNSTTGTRRDWGLDEWSSRATQGTFLHWAVANALLPDRDTNPTHTGVQVIDRTTVPELAELTALAADFQTKMDQANARLNPLGLSPGAIAFDISSSDLKAGKSHYEQIYDRSLRAVLNAKGAFDQAARMTRLLRNQENQIASSNDSIVDQERAFTRQLTEIYGTPYPGEIGPGKVYAQGYTGPDLLEWFIVDRPTDMVNTTAALSIATRVPTNISTFAWFGVTPGTTSSVVPFTADQVTGAYTSMTARTLTVQPNSLVQYADQWAGGNPLGLRSVTGKLQQALLDTHQAHVALQAAATTMQNRYATFERRLHLYLEMLRIRQAIADRLDTDNAEIKRLQITERSLATVAETMGTAAQGIKDMANSIQEFFPRINGLANDMTFTIRGSTSISATALSRVLLAAKVGFTVGSKVVAGQVEATRISMESAVEDFGFSYEQAQNIYEFELLLRECAHGYLEVAQLATALQRTNEQLRNTLAEGDRIQSERELFRQRAAALVQGYRTRDLTFRTFRNEALEQYRSLFDLAGRYTYLAAKSYDYETGLLGSTTGQAVIDGIVASRALGDLTGGVPQATVSTLGDAGLAGTMARLQSDWSVAKGRLGINNPDTNGTVFSLRRELFRILDDAGANDDDAQWHQTLEQHIVSNVLADPDVVALCRNLGFPDGRAVPGIVIPFTTSIQHGYNFFGLPLASGDHQFSASNFATKIYSAGISLRGYVGMDPYAVGQTTAGTPAAGHPNALSASPYVYLVPTGTDYMLAPPLGDTGGVRAFTVRDQALPLPFNLGATQFSTTQFFNANGSLTETPWILRKHQGFRAVHDPAFFFSSTPSEFTSSRLVGRSVWNGGWKLIIPAYTLLNAEQEGLNRFVASVKDIELFLRTYSHSGN